MWLHFWHIILYRPASDWRRNSSVEPGHERLITSHSPASHLFLITVYSSVTLCFLVPKLAQNTHNRFHFNRIYIIAYTSLFYQKEHKVIAYKVVVLRCRLRISGINFKNNNKNNTMKMTKFLYKKINRYFTVENDVHWRKKNKFLRRERERRVK